MEGCNKLGVRKGAWTREEDTLLRQCIESYGEGKWHQVPSKTGLNRCRKSCRLRWLNHLKPNIKRGEFTEDETDLIIRLHKLLGNRWSLIAGRLPGRTANDVKNYWNTRLRMDSRMKRMKDENQETAKTITVRPQPRRFMKSSHCLSNKAKILQHIQSEENFSRPSQTSPLIENEIDWWNTLLDDNEASTRSYLGVEDDLWTNFWVEDLEQSTRTCVTFAEGGCRSDFSFSVDFWNNSKEEDRT